MERTVEGGARSLALMAGGAAELLGRVLAVGADEQVLARMGAKLLDTGLGQHVPGKPAHFETIRIGH